MVLNIKSSVGTGFLRSFDCIAEIFPSCVFQDGLQLACKPVFVTVFVCMFDALKCLLTVFYKITHNTGSFFCHVHTADN